MMRGCCLRSMGFIVVALIIAACGKSPAVLEEACNQRVAASCYDLGEKYFSGSGVSQDKNQAVQLFERACEGREARGCDRARQMFQESCDNGRPVGCSNLGRIYLEGFGVTPDAVKAAEFYDKACGLGDAISCSNLAMMYGDGNGVARDPGKAAQLYAKACQSGFSSACDKISKESQGEIR